MSELKLRLKKLAATGVWDKVDSIVLYNGERNQLDSNATYFSNSASEYSIVVLKPGSATLHTVPMMAPGLHSWAPVKVNGSLFETMKRALKAKRVGVNGSSLPWRVPRVFKARPIDVSRELLKPREIKTPYEIAALRAAVRETKKIAMGIHYSGRTEYEVALGFESRVRKAGFEPSFGTIVASGSNTRSPHHVNSKTKIKDLVYLDCGIRRNNYVSDLTFAHALNSKYSPHVELVQNVLAQLQDEIKPGVSCADLHKKSMTLLGKYGKYLIHALGHGIGIDVHEGPHFGPSSKDIVQEGMVIAVEPAFYTKHFGVRVERNYVVTKNGCKEL